MAYGVAMCGIGMLTLTGNTISMDVFGPVADNANGIGEMGYDKKEMGEEKYKKARQILADLDAVGNTTKAVTKGIAIGSAVIAAVSLFASFIAVMAMGSEEKISEMTTAQYNNVAGMLTVANPTLFIGLLIGGAVPFLFSSMTIRAVGRAAFLIVKECRIQFRDKEIWAGTKKPDYGRVVGICTSAAQKELIGPGLLAIMAPLSVGFLLGPLALAGFLAGMILVGQLLAVFMANAGGAWDNAKKLIEDEPRDLAKNTGKGSEKHKAAVTGDTVGDPLKDTAGPAINPLIKVMNMVSLLLLQGQSVRTRAVYAAPLIIECEVELENRLASDGSFAVGFVPADSPRDVDPVNIRQFRLIYRNPGAYSGQDGLVLEGRNDASGSETIWGEEPFLLEAGKPYVVRLEITPEHLLVVINGRAYDLKDVKIPYNRFYVQLGSWQPVNRWHVRNFVVR